MNKTMEQIDFEEATREWRKNKIYIKNGIFHYKCAKMKCNNSIYLYTTEHKYFKRFASKFDLLNRNNPKKYYLCEDHLLCGDC